MTAVPSAGNSQLATIPFVGRRHPLAGQRQRWLAKEKQGQIELRVISSRLGIGIQQCQCVAEDAMAPRQITAQVPVRLGQLEMSPLPLRLPLPLMNTGAAEVRLCRPSEWLANSGILDPRCLQH
jgi:hypothetical protein